jgi:hypothetical protein
MNRKAAKQLVVRMERVANYVEANYRKLGLSKKEAYNMCMTLDRMADVLDEGELSSWTPEYEEDLTPASPDKDPDLELQSDELVYMNHYNAPSELEEGDADEDSYMDAFNGSDYDNVHDYALEDRKAARRQLRASEEDEDDHEAAFSFFAEEDEDEDHEAGFSFLAEEDEDDHEAAFSFFAKEEEDDDHEASRSPFRASEKDEDDHESSRRSTRSRFADADEDADEDKEATRTSSWRREAEEKVRARQAARRSRRS